MFGTAANAISRPDNPFRVSNQRAHEKFMVFAEGAGTALSPYAIALGITALPPAGDAVFGMYTVAGSVARTYGPRLTLGACLGWSCWAGKVTHEDPGEFAEQSKRLEDMYNAEQAELRRVYHIIVNAVKKSP